MASSETVDAVASDSPASPSEEETNELDEAGVAEVASASSKSASDDLVCRREKIPGSNFSKKVCFTRAEIDAREQQSQDAVREMRKTGTNVVSPNGG